MPPPRAHWQLMYCAVVAAEQLFSLTVETSVVTGRCPVFGSGFLDRTVSTILMVSMLAMVAAWLLKSMGRLAAAPPEPCGYAQKIASAALVPFCTFCTST